VDIYGRFGRRLKSCPLKEMGTPWVAQVNPEMLVHRVRIGLLSIMPLLVGAFAFKISMGIPKHSDRSFGFGLMCKQATWLNRGWD